MTSHDLSFLDKRAEKFLQNLIKLNIEEVHDAVKTLKIDVERLRMENLWMEEYLKENAPKPEIAFKKKQIKFESSLSVTGIKLQSFSVPTSSIPLNSSMKSDFCEQEIFKIERELKKKQNQSFQEMKNLIAKTQESEITCREFSKIIGEFSKKVLEEKSDPKTKKDSSKAFIEDLTRNSATIATSIRMKTETMKSDCRQSKRTLMKREELSSCLQPIDFELVTLEKEKFKKMEEEKKSYYKGLKNDEVSMASQKSSELNEFLKAKIKFNEIARKIQLSEKNIKTMECEAETLKNDISAFKQSIIKDEEFSKVYEAPSVANYIGKISERDKLKQKLKVIERRKAMMKSRLKRAKKMLRDSAGK